jgi:hypothetical protein
MRDVLGVSVEEIRTMAIPIELRDVHTGAPLGNVFHVMHPVHCLQSRVYDILVLGENTEHARRQLRASVICARQFILTLADTGHVRDALKLNERIFQFVMNNLHGRRIHSVAGVDPFDAVATSHALPEAFRVTRYPQMCSALANKRKALRVS